MSIALLVIICDAIILTLAPAIRLHSDSSNYVFRHWIGVLVWAIVFAGLHYQSSIKLTNRDPYLLPIVALLNGLGLMTIWRLYPNFGLRQSIWLLISGAVIYIALYFPSLIKLLHRYKYLWLVLGLILTALTIVWGTNPSGFGPELWFDIFGIYFQPSEPLKLLFIAFLAGYFSDRFEVTHGKWQTLLPTLIINGIAVLLLIFQRDLGTALVFIFLYFTILFAAQGKKLVLWLSAIFLFVSAAAGYFFIDIVRLRIDTWLTPFTDPSGSSYQIIQSWIAVAEGNLIGTGAGLGNPNLIPVSLSDFIFSAISEENGLLGAMCIILLFILLLFHGVKISKSTQNAFQRYLSLGLVFYIGIQSILIIGGNLGLFPLTGVTLPFVSYGGTSLLVSFIGLYFLMTISSQPPTNEVMIASKQPRISLLSGLMIGLYIIEIITTSIIGYWLRTPLVDRPENPRWSVVDRYSQRGDILDRNNQVIISNTGDIGNYQRTTSHIPLTPIIGYTNPIYGQTGIELSMYSYLRGNQGYNFQTIFWQDLLYNQPPDGLDIRLTLDLDLQKEADFLLGNSSGTIVVMNANSGEILAMASHPYFNASELSEEWESLIENENAPLVNRATQGVYPPGSAIFPYILSAALELNLALPDPNSISDIANSECALSINHELTWGALVNYGCVEAQSILVDLLGVNSIADFLGNLDLFSQPALHLDIAMVEQPGIEESAAYLQGIEPLTITPLQMALAASTITNNGTRPGPRIVNAYLSPAGDWETIPKLSTSKEVLSPEISAEVSNLMQVPGESYWEVSALLETSDEKPVSWWVAGTTTAWPGQPITIVVLLESADQLKAEEIGTSLINSSIQ